MLSEVAEIKTWLTDSLTEWQGHLLSCPGQLKKKFYWTSVCYIGQYKVMWVAIFRIFLICSLEPWLYFWGYNNFIWEIFWGIAPCQHQVNVLNTNPKIYHFQFFLSHNVEVVKSFILTSLLHNRKTHICQKRITLRTFLLHQVLCGMIFIVVSVNPLEYQEKCLWWKNYQRPERGNWWLFVSNILFMILLHGSWIEKLDLKHNWHAAINCVILFLLFVMSQRENVILYFTNRPKF